MTQAVVSQRAKISGSGWSNPLTFASLYLEDETHIEVWADDTQLSLGTDYTVSGLMGSGFTVTITAPSSWTPTNWYIIHTPPLSQGTDLSSGGSFGTAYESGLDKIIRRVQSLGEQVDRAPKLKISTPSTTPTLPEPSSDKLVGWNTGATDLENKTAAGITGEVLPATANTYLRRDSDNNGFEAKTAAQVLTDLAPTTADITHDPGDTGSSAVSLFNILNYKKYIENFSSIQACIDAVEAYGGGTVTCAPNAQLDVSTALTVQSKNVKIDLGPGAYFNSTHLTENVIVVGNGTDQIDNFELGNFDAWASVTKTAGWTVLLQRVTNTWIGDHLVLGSRWRYTAASNTNPLYNGIYADEFGDLVFSGGIEAYGLATALKANGDASGNWGAELSISGKSHFIDNIIHHHIAGGVGGFYPHRCAVSEGGTGLLLDTTGAAITNREIWTNDVVFDNIDGVAVDIGDDSCSIYKQDGGWISGCGKVTGSLPGFRASATNAGLRAKIRNSEIRNNDVRGIEFSSGYLQLTDNDIYGNGDDGVYVAGSSTRATIIGNSIDNNGAYGLDASGMTGSAILTLKNNDFFSNTTDDVSKPAGGTFRAKGNTGFLTEFKGTVTISDTDTSSTVAHGLDHVPNNPQVSALGGYYGGQDVAVDATNITVSVPVAPGGGSSYSFAVEIS